MKAKLIVFLICLCFLFMLDVYAQKVAVFKEANKPDSINIGNGYIYIQEKTTIFIYNLNNYKFVKQFGKEGEGPGELKINPFGAPMILTPHKDKVYISSLSKLSIFTKTGEYIKEYGFSSMDTYFPFGEKYVCFSTAPKEENSRNAVLAFFLAGKNLKKERVIYKSDFEVSQNTKINFPITPFDPYIDGDKLYVIDGIEGFAINVYNHQGKKINRIKKDYKQLKIPSAYREKTFTWFKQNPNYKQLFELLKNRISFKKYYPPIYSINVDKGKIFVTTNALVNDKRECIVMDLKGNEIKRVYLPIPEQYGMNFKILFAIKNNTFYMIEENMANETWELHRIKL